MILDLVAEQHLVERARADAGAAGERLENGPDGIGPGEVGLGERAHGAAPVGLVVDPPELFQVTQRLAHGREAAVELARDLRLHEPLPGHVFRP